MTAIAIDKTIGNSSVLRQMHSEHRKTRIAYVERLPRHWDEMPLKAVATINPAKLSENTDPDYEIEYVDIGNVSLVEGITSSETYRFELAPSRARRRVRDGDTIISTVRTYLKAVARVCTPPENLIVSTGFAVLRPNTRLSPSFLYRFIQSEPFVQSVVANSVGVSYPAINAGELGHFFIPVPPASEQQKIVAFLDDYIGKIDELSGGMASAASGRGALAKVISTLTEQRASLIAAAVTGEIDLRNYRPRGEA